MIMTVLTIAVGFGLGICFGVLLIAGIIFMLIGNHIGH